MAEGVGSNEAVKVMAKFSHLLLMLVTIVSLFFATSYPYLSVSKFGKNNTSYGFFLNKMR